MTANNFFPLMDRRPGEYPLETLPPKDWANASVTFERSNGKKETRIEIIDLRSKPYTRYLQEPMRMIACKCFWLVWGLLLYCLGYAAFHAIRLPIATVLNCSPTVFVKQIWALVRIPFYYIALTCAALYGVFKPLEGRAWFGSLESRLHDGKSRREAVQYKEEKEFSLSRIWDGLSLKEEPREALFLAFCMQPLGITNTKINGQSVEARQQVQMQILPAV